MPPDGSPISSLRPGDQVDGLFACTRKARLSTRSGSPYLALELRDRTGSVPARVFSDADAIGAGFERGDLVRVRGRVDRFRDELVVEASSVKPAEAADPALFLPSAYRDLDELEGFFEHLTAEVYDRGYRALLEAVLADGALRRELRRAPCTRAGHHSYLGGLLEHTVAVATLAQSVCELHRRLNADLLVTAALVHDVGRTREFTYGAEFGLTEEGRLLGHVAIGEQIVSALAARVGLDDTRRIALLHCLLCHHGPELAPGRRFGSPEALALYRLNSLEAGVKGALEQGLPG
jgi:3'-5' exoribonuclease